MGLLLSSLPGHPWIPLTKAIGAELWCFLWSAPEQTAEQAIATLVIWDAIALIMASPPYATKWISKRIFLLLFILYKGGQMWNCLPDVVKDLLNYKRV